MPPKRLSTQIGGSYSPENQKLLPLKAALVAAGYDVRHPIGDSLEHHDGRWRAVQTGQAAPHFPSIERHYYDCIRDCDFHCVANFQASSPGTLGASAATEIGYAILCSKPILLTDPIVLARSVDASLQKVIDTNQPRFHWINFEPAEPANLTLWREGFIGPVEYERDIDADLAIMRCIIALFDAL
jgi:hypothetical protein